MVETAGILHLASARSLVILDEIGRGTATFDGLSIAWAVAEYLHNSADHAAKTLFATHYHELTELAERLPGAQNYQITATEREGEVVFLHRLERGRASKSYGIEVARLAGLPPVVISSARDVLAQLERYELEVFGEDNGTKGALQKAGRRKSAAQVSLFDLANQNVIQEIRDTPDFVSAEEAKELLLRLKKQLL
jgi:DNA mismatch repair protein MutS